MDLTQSSGKEGKSDGTRVLENSIRLAHNTDVLARMKGEIMMLEKLSLELKASTEELILKSKVPRKLESPPRKNYVFTLVLICSVLVAVVVSVILVLFKIQSLQSENENYRSGISEEVLWNLKQDLEKTTMELFDDFVEVVQRGMQSDIYENSGQSHTEMSPAQQLQDSVNDFEEIEEVVIQGIWRKVIGGIMGFACFGLSSLFVFLLFRKM